MVSSKLEFAVENIKDDEALKSFLLNVPGISKVDVLSKKNLVLIETVLSCSEANDAVQRFSGSRAVLQGFGVGGSAVAIIEGEKSHGIIRLSRTTATSQGSLLDGTIDGLAPGEHVLNIHVSGDLSQGCQSIGPVLEPSGRLTRIIADLNGRANFKFITPDLEVNDILGRSIAVSTVDEMERVACGVIARSAGLFENNKKICACDGVTVWDERNVPIAGHNRRQEATKKN